MPRFLLTLIVLVFASALPVVPAQAIYDDEARFARRAGCTDDIDNESTGDDSKTKRAEKACTKLLAGSALSNTQRGYALYARGTLRTGLARYPEALADVEEAVTLLPSFGKVL